MNPYEIRLELLKLARDILSDSKSIEIQKESETWNAHISFCDKNSTEVPPFPVIDSITTFDVLKEAVKLNKFVSGE